VQAAKQSRIVQTPKRLEFLNDAAKDTPTDFKIYLKRQFFEFMDIIVTQLQSRFGQPEFHKLMKLEQLLTSDNFSENLQNISDNLGENVADFDVSNLIAQLKVLSSIIPRNGWTLNAIVKILNKESLTVRKMLSEIIKLLELTNCIPASVASAERSFSALRRVKTYLQGAISQEWLTLLMLLHVHRDLAFQIDIDEVCQKFVSLNQERKCVFGNSK